MVETGGCLKEASSARSKSFVGIFPPLPSFLRRATLHGHHPMCVGVAAAVVPVAVKAAVAAAAAADVTVAIGRGRRKK